MTRSHLVAWLRTHSRLVTLLAMAPLIVAILGLAACVKHPVGDPEKSTMDPKFAGVWVTKAADEDQTLVFIRPYDARTYFVNMFSYRPQATSIEPVQRFNCKAWLTLIGGETFMTMEPLNCDHFAGLREQPPYLVLKLSLTASQLEMRLVNGDNEAVSKATNAKELEAVIEKHVHAEAIYGGEAVVLTKAEDKTLIESVLKAFRPGATEEW